MDERVSEYLRKHKEDQLAFLKSLIRADTTIERQGESGKEMNGQVLIRKRLESIGMDVDVFEPDESRLETYKEMNRGHDYKDRPNVVGVLKGTGNGRSIVLNGHIDTMPFDNLDEWHAHPLDPVVKDGKLYGRGSCDMKAGLAACVLAVEALVHSGVRLKGDVILQSVVDEEGGGNGTLACIERGYTADGAIFAEPTELNIMPAHMGFLFYRIVVRGKALHSAMKWRGVSAIEKMMKIMQALQELERRWAIEKRHTLLPPPTISFGTIHGGLAGSIVPDECRLELTVHYLPADADEHFLGGRVEEEILETIEGVVQADRWLKDNRPEIVNYQQGGGYEIDPRHPLVQVLADCCREEEGKEPVIRGAEFGCDARLLNNYGRTPSVIFGPGSIERAHSINEYVEIDQYYKCISILANLLIQWCGRE